MNDYLKKILAHKKESIKKRKKILPRVKLDEMASMIKKPRDFIHSIRKSDRINIIGELKRASPSAGLIRKEFDIKDLAQKMVKGGAGAISVLTEEKYFKGNLIYLTELHESVDIPILRKDFILDEYQLFESRVYFADAVLLIAGILSFEQLVDYVSICNKLNMSALVEVHNENDVQKALGSRTGIIGINNRSLNDFSVDINTTFKLLPMIPKNKVIVSESGIKTKDDVRRLKEAGVDAVLIGETLMRSENIEEKLKELAL